MNPTPEQTVPAAKAGTTLDQSMAELSEMFKPWRIALLKVQPGLYNTNDHVQRILGRAFGWLTGTRDAFKGGWVKVTHVDGGVQFTWRDGVKWEPNGPYTDGQALMIDDDGEILYYHETSSDVKSVTQGPFYTPTAGNANTLARALTFITWLNRKLADGDLLPYKDRS